MLAAVGGTVVVSFVPADGCGSPHDLRFRFVSRGVFVQSDCSFRLIPFLVALTMLRCGRAGQWGVALELLKETRKHGPNPTVSVYIATAQACARAGKWEEATALMEASSQNDYVTVAVSASGAESTLMRLWCSCSVLVSAIHAGSSNKHYMQRYCCVAMQVCGYGLEGVLLVGCGR